MSKSQQQTTPEQVAPTQEEIDRANQFLNRCREEMKKFLPHYHPHAPKKNSQQG